MRASANWKEIEKVGEGDRSSPGVMHQGPRYLLRSTHLSLFPSSLSINFSSDDVVSPTPGGRVLLLRCDFRLVYYTRGRIGKYRCTRRVLELFSSAFIYSH